MEEHPKFKSKEDFEKAKEEWKEGGIWHKDYPIDSNTGRVVGHEKGIHGEYPHINVRRTNKKQVHIDVVGPKKKYGGPRKRRRKK